MFMLKQLQPLGLEDIPVIEFQESMERVIQKELTISKHIGVTMLLSSNRRPSSNLMVCLTTKDKIYALRPDIKTHIQFFHKQMERCDLEFYVKDGCRVAYYLKKYAKFVLDYANDIATFDIFLSLRNQFINGQAPSNHYTITYIQENLKHLKRKRKTIASHWLSTEIHESTPEERDEISISPLTDKTKIAIKKDAAHTRALGLRLYEEFDSMLGIESELIYSFTLRTSATAMECYERKGDNSLGYLRDFLNHCPPLF